MDRKVLGTHWVVFQYGTTSTHATRHATHARHTRTPHARCGHAETDTHTHTHVLDTSPSCMPHCFFSNQPSTNHTSKPFKFTEYIFQASTLPALSTQQQRNNSRKHYGKTSSERAKSVRPNPFGFRHRESCRR